MNHQTKNQTTGVEPWICPRCQQQVGLKNIGTAAHICQACDDLAYYAGLGVTRKARLALKYGVPAS